MAEESLESFLEKLGLEDTIYTFKKEDIDLDLLQTMTLEELKETGLSLGKRKKILNALKSKGRYIFLICFIVSLYLFISFSIKRGGRRSLYICT